MLYGRYDASNDDGYSLESEPLPENLWSQMRRMGLGETEASHLVLGNVKQALELLVQQRYLQKDKVNGP
ncbi:hypothetical protein JHK82_039787 [Glycine max]|nr:hypothetical protein JHK86_039986 [Glycine max]KAG4965586.1 hypothetical protein JHK85_040561 [Glycine max]KAG5110564.1 hypothetical protein JHK82_039787 [Glycine max]KAG5121857.1 hypothetical protein JHK84_040197 [Glycine max]